MAAYTFETITASQALAFTAADTLSFTSGTAIQFTVVYGSDGNITITNGARSVAFAPALATVSKAAFGLTFADGSLLYVGDAGTDSLSISPAAPGAMFGGDGDDTLQLGIRGGLLQGNAGNDTLRTPAQATIYGGQGNDSITTTDPSTSSFLQGNKGDDLISGGSADTLLGGQGNDTLTGGGFLNGNLGDDSISASAGVAFGEDGNDTISATGNATIDAGAGNDSLIGTSGSNTLLGGAGADTLESGQGVDLLTGGAGADVFQFLSSGGAASGTVDQITDWSTEDRLHFRPAPAGYSGFTSFTNNDYTIVLNQVSSLIASAKLAYVAVQVGHDVVVFAANAGGIDVAVDLVGRSLADISASNII
jgi:Ca2+-binding RTX toxin-like protein